MSADISGFGTVVNLTASVTFPAGISITQASDDTDFIDVPSLQIKDSAMGVNGDLLIWSKANPIKPTLSVVPNSDDDVNLGVLLEANRVAKNKTSALDIINMTFVLPNGATITFSNGSITDGMTSDSVASGGRLKTKVYSFVFENRTITKSPA